MLTNDDAAADPKVVPGLTEAAADESMDDEDKESGGCGG